MALPTATALYTGVHKAYIAGGSGTITLNGSATVGDGTSIVTWEWSAVPFDPNVQGGSPPYDPLNVYGHVDLMGYGDFNQGKAWVQNPVADSFIAAMSGGLCFSLRVKNDIGQWSDPSPSGDGTDCQVVLWTHSPYPAPNEYDWSAGANNMLVSASDAVGTSDRFMRFDLDLEEIETSLTYQTKVTLYALYGGNGMVWPVFAGTSWRVEVGAWVTGGGGSADFRLTFNGTDLDLSTSASSETLLVGTHTGFPPPYNEVLPVELKLKRTAGGTDARFKFFRVYEVFG